MHNHVVYNYIKMKNTKAQIRTMKAKRFQAHICDRRAQIRMTETVAVIFIFLILVVIGIVFFSKYQEGAAQEKVHEQFVKQAQEITTKLLYSPELTCTRGEAEAESFCFDLMKVQAAQEAFKDEYYFDIFSFARVTVNQTYPEKKGWILYERKKPEYTKITPTYFTLSLKDPGAGHKGEAAYRYGFVKVEVFG